MREKKQRQLSLGVDRKIPGDGRGKKSTFEKKAMPVQTSPQANRVRCNAYRRGGKCFLKISKFIISVLLDKTEQGGKPLGEKVFKTLQFR